MVGVELTKDFNMAKMTKNQRIVFYPYPNTVGKLRLALSGYEGGLTLSSPVKVIITDPIKGERKPYTMTIRHTGK